MLPSEQDTIHRLSKLQREFLIDHIDGFKPFRDDHLENVTRESLLERRLIRWEPLRKGRLGMPKGTVITDPLGREARAMILGWYADALTRSIGYCALDENKERALLRVLMENAKHWRHEEPQDNLNGRPSQMKRKRHGHHIAAAPNPRESNRGE